MRRLVLPVCAVILAAGSVFAADAPSIAGKPDAYFSTAEGKKTVDNILTWQGHGPGGVMAWPKAYKTEIPRPADGGNLEWAGIATIDNGATYSELHILARAISFEQDKDRLEKLKIAFYKGLDAVLEQQYPNGGWPQRFPPGQPGQAAYDKHITFNDNAMTRLLTEVLRPASTGAAPYAFVDDDHRKRAQASVDKAIDCILKCQIVVNGKLTGWCAQHDEVTLKPANGRAYELASISGSEGSELVDLLMQIEKPDERVRKAVDAAAAWFDSAKIVGKKFVVVTAADGTKDRVLQDDPASTIWARFYDVETGKPMFCGRDGVKKFDVKEIEVERRTGYAWYGNWGAKVAKSYAAWKKKNPTPA